MNNYNKDGVIFRTNLNVFISKGERDNAMDPSTLV